MSLDDPMAKPTAKPAQLQEEVGMYVDALRKRYPAIEQVWLIGPRVNASDSRGADWDLVAFANDDVLEDVRSDPEWRRDDVDLLVVVDGNEFERAWGAPRKGRLSDLDWRLEDAQTATYVDGGPTDAPRAVRSAAVRVR